MKKIEIIPSADCQVKIERDMNQSNIKTMRHEEYNNFKDAIESLRH